MEVISIADKLKKISTHWEPKIIAELNGQHVKLAKLKGEFVWHSHEHEDELFMVVSGILDIHFRDSIRTVTAGEIIVIPKGIDHKPVAVDEVSVLLFEPSTTINTGDSDDFNLRREDLDRI
ncbi:MAG TPA: cupin domain-containing protein [Flavobacteriales bacterium]|nr:cupin domain-containing protein [Flavobacteriales bacterium]HAW21259.1 cupin domain-containing protein [Flavobacteriales bacterium]